MIQIKKKISNNNLEKNFRKAKKNEINIIQNISRSLYKDSRYYFDHNFNRKRVQDFYDQWIQKAIYGTFDDVCFVLTEKNIPVSYCTIRYLNKEHAVIGLFGVSTKYTGKGYGKKLINNILIYLNNQGYKKVLVVTQGRNYKAQRLYQSAGFMTNSTELWYHKWIN